MATFQFLRRLQDLLPRESEGWVVFDVRTLKAILTGTGGMLNRAEVWVRVQALDRTSRTGQEGQALHQVWPWYSPEFRSHVNRIALQPHRVFWLEHSGKSLQGLAGPLLGGPRGGHRMFTLCCDVLTSSRREKDRGRRPAILSTRQWPCTGLLEIPCCSV